MDHVGPFEVLFNVQAILLLVQLATAAGSTLTVFTTSHLHLLVNVTGSGYVW
jgi:hypothetical protein